MHTRMLLSVLAASVTLTAPTSAFGQTNEPNDSIEQATGPVVGDVPVSGVLETINDQDYFRVNVLGGQQVHIDVRYDRSAGGCIGSAEFLDSTGATVHPFFV